MSARPAGGGGNRSMVIAKVEVVAVVALRNWMGRYIKGFLTV
jgi:hypothetical protein